MKMLIVFEKTFRLRHIGHLDLMRTMQRALRRSGLPVAYSQGFNPHLLLNFAAPLSVGMSGKREIMEVPLSAEISPEAFQEKLSAALPPDLPCIHVKAVDDRHPAPMSLLKAASFEAQVDQYDIIASKIADFMAQETIPAIRKTKTGDKPCDLKPMIYELKAENGKLYMTLALCEEATCKPDLLLTALSEFCGIEKPHALFERTFLLGEWMGQFVPLENL